MPIATASITFEYEKSEDPRGYCSCGAQPKKDVQTFYAGAEVYVDDDGTIKDSGAGVEMDEIWNSSETVYVDELPLLVCEDGHYYVNSHVKDV